MKTIHPVAATLLLLAASASSVAAEAASAAAAQTTAPLKPCTSVTADPPVNVVLGKSAIIPLKSPVARMLVGGASAGASRAGKPAEAAEKGAPPAPFAQPVKDGVGDAGIVLLSPTELFFLGKRVGSMNVVLQSADGRCLAKSLNVTIDPEPLKNELAILFPDETGIAVKAVDNSLVLSGSISDSIKLDQALNLAASHADGNRVINMLRVSGPQQVMLEVKIAEVSKTLLDELGSSVSATRNSSGGTTAVSLITSFLSQGGGLIQALKVGKYRVGIDGEKDDGLVRVLAEPNIMAISGQSASFLSGGKIFIPVPQSSLVGGTAAFTLEEKEFGIGVHFTPTVLDGSRINLKLVSEVSELSQTGTPFSAVNGSVSVIPSMTVRRADTTVQLNDGQSFVIAGLIKNNASESIKAFPGLGEIPVLGALFRSTQFQTDQTELLFVVTPRFVKPLAEPPQLPTSNHVLPDRLGIYLNGKLEGTPAGSPAKE
ncbi:MAG TPA: type II and III secretion system protein family protein [Burkholderiaceae bacterium]